jgi:hypothetical protein
MPEPTDWRGDPDATARVARIPGIEPGTRALVRPVADGALGALLSRDPITGRWHLSISHPRRYPTWDEIRDARYALIPDGVTMAMLLPPRAQYVNVHPNCFHLHQINDADGL